MRYEAEGGDPANAGLQHARVFLEPVRNPIVAQILEETSLTSLGQAKIPLDHLC